MGLSQEWFFRHRTCLVVAVVGSVLAAGTIAGYAQSSSAQSSNDPSSDTPSLGDLVRKQKQKQQEAKAQGVKPKKVVTDEDISAHREEHAADADSTSDDSPQADAEVTPAGVVARSGDEWKAAISQQKTAIADLKSRIDKVQSSIHFVEANAYRNGVEYNKIQARKQEAETRRGRTCAKPARRDAEESGEHAGRRSPCRLRECGVGSLTGSLTKLPSSIYPPL
jgi:hypothetical protein